MSERPLQHNPDPLRVTYSSRCRKCRRYAPSCICPDGADYEESTMDQDQDQTTTAPARSAIENALAFAVLVSPLFENIKVKEVREFITSASEQVERALRSDG